MSGQLKATKGKFIRSESSYRTWVTKDGNAGPTDEGGFDAEPGPEIDFMFAHGHEIIS